MIGVIYPTHNTLAGNSLGPVPPVNYFLLGNDSGGIILNDSGDGFVIAIEPSTLRSKKNG